MKIKKCKQQIQALHNEINRDDRLLANLEAGFETKFNFDWIWLLYPLPYFYIGLQLNPTKAKSLIRKLSKLLLDPLLWKKLIYFNLVRIIGLR